MRNKKDKAYLQPIGRVVSEDKVMCLELNEEYGPALKYLELFSHALLFVIEEKVPVASEVVKEHKEVNFEVVKLERVDLKKRKIYWQGLELEEGTLVFDIKPYFPCENRVQDAVSPSCEKKRRTLIQQVLKEASSWLEQELLLPFKGEIHKEEGSTFIPLPKEEILWEKLTPYSHVHVVWWFHQWDQSIYRKVTTGDPPYEKAPRTGIFATRSPIRPNPIALTTARIVKRERERGRLYLSELDAFDNTPYLGIIPYEPSLDCVASYHVPKWLSHWPEWFVENNNSLETQNLTLKPLEIEKLTPYLESNGPIPPALKKERNEVKLEEAPKKGIYVKGARQHNLQNIHCFFPYQQLSVITGLSGSGKSSLAFDTLYAESQRRFMSSLSGQGAQQGGLEKPEVDQITGLPPAIAIGQHLTNWNPRSTVGTLTNLYDYLKLLYNGIGIRHCPECGRGIIPLKESEILHLLCELKPGTLLSIQGYGQEQITYTGTIPLAGKQGDFKSQLKKGIQRALMEGQGALYALLNNQEACLLQTKEMCYPCKKIFFDRSLSTFSFNHPESMCPVCKGLGIKMEVNPEAIVTKPELSLLDGASPWWGNLRKHLNKPNANWIKGELIGLAHKLDVDLERPWEQLPSDFKEMALYGSQGEEVRFTYEMDNGRKGEIVRPVEGACPIIKRLFLEGKGGGDSVLPFMKQERCPACKGERLAPEGRLVTVAGRRFPEAVGMTLEGLMHWIENLPNALDDQALAISQQLLDELHQKLCNLVTIGLGYLSLDRSIPSLSGGEAQRLRLASQLGEGMSQLLYILDEPTKGLHPKDYEKLIHLLYQLRDSGNTVVVVEHQKKMMLAADWLIEVGPGAGRLGGKLLAQGRPEEVMGEPLSQTGSYLRASKENKLISYSQAFSKAQWLKIEGATAHNLKHINVAFPLGSLTCVTGVSGSGKSTLIHEIILPYMTDTVEQATGFCKKFEGKDAIKGIVAISQQPIGRTPRSNPATYCGVFDEIRKLFAQQEQANQKGYTASTFSFNSPQGQCEGCKGEGKRCIPMYFMPDAWVSCNVCGGKRFKKEVLEITYQGKTISDVLEMTVEDALQLFQGEESIVRYLQTLQDVGLGYMKLGQSALTLSGGEAQRVKLAKELSRETKGKILYLLDEPTTGLHPQDIQKLLTIFKRLTTLGHTVLLIEHHLDLIKEADWLIDLGPQGGDQGGEVVAMGSPYEVTEVKESFTGQALREYIHFMD